ncbi:type I-C CRISPR-associated protein Cas8c/Csd1 [Domibacillus antri]|uniref:Type I-C CRISPR-associated protein Cas8c/Csd1 n=1 Tax=Domibacillus antri TaxID=1714264 RepID=A0A1Q8Q503_9BACI|nr:type I-C CRISPR-associated protein Cas8c/Csd1 [Domibacillus antri]OLN22430.1 type I-C CRISPR-associated protein Cas8c/Csd1 [Domibacillus antri]
MSIWLQLYKTYEANLDRVGITEKKGEDREFTLLPISHTTQTAHIEVLITPEGDFHSAEVIEKGQGNTLIPCTEEAASRAGSKVAPYPLHDKLSYVAGDFVKYGGQIKGEDPFEAYIKALKKWAESPHAVSKVKSIYKYVSKRRLIEDLIQEKVFIEAADGKLLWKWDNSRDQKPLIYSVVTGSLDGAFVRFTVYSAKEDLEQVWKDREMHQSFIRFYDEQLGDEDLCYVTGTIQPRTERHANKIRNAGDKAKLISANDTSGFTFRGRFSHPTEAVSISYDVSQKAHNALKWLINKQAKIVDQRVFLVWGNTPVPDPTEDSYSMAALLAEEKEKSVKKESDTHHLYAREVSKAIAGYRGKLNSDDNVNILVMDSATTGRLALLYYRNMDKEIYLDRLEDWHTKHVWEHRYRKTKDKQLVVFNGAPATKDIAFAAYGPRVSDKVVKGLMERMLPCVVDGQKIPFDIVRSAFQRASNPGSMENEEWEKTLSIACALINKQEEMSVSLDLQNKDRDYLFGRLLALADVLERQALGRDEKRATNAIRYMHSFAQHPERTWCIIQGALQPYQARLGTRVSYLNRLIDEVGASIKIEDFNNKSLSGKYLLGFYSQRNELYKKKETKPEDENE